MRNFSWKLCVPYFVMGWVTASEGVTITSGYFFWAILACMLAVEVLARKQGYKMALELGWTKNDS